MKQENKPGNKQQITITKKLSKGEDGYKIISVRIRNELGERLDVLSEETNRSRNELINMLLTSALDIAKIED